MKTIRCKALQPFTYNGDAIARGAIVDLPADQAAVERRLGRVSLSRRYLTAELTPPPEPDKPRRRRRYQRADMQAEE